MNLGPDFNLFQYNPREEFWHWFTHLGGVIVAFFAFFWLILKATPLPISYLITAIVYGISSLLLFSFSTIYHYTKRPNHKLIFKYLDHISIYLLIAGTYTPFFILGVHTSFGRYFLLSVWVVALGGIIYELIFLGKNKIVSTIIYVIMGNLALLAIQQIFTYLSFEQIVLLLGGGFLYTSGAIFYLMKKIPFNHVIWHLFVLGGYILHLMAVMLFYMQSGS
ncbi:MAG: hemolysin III family protein [Oligoflexia bacterium]|nr:hemolysin III family protein [Oligoflexia bacterium]